MIDVMQTIDILVELLRRLETVSKQLPEENFEWNEEKEKFEIVRLPPDDREIAAVDEVRDLADELFRTVWEARVDLVGAELRAEKKSGLTVLDVG